ncbi:MAG: aldo/keto reductase [Hamadaea sp.]|uniref:aldo/keto reductase n=1 Tax=Hamadaea sp. TaxID=2024425 RepID=UPI0017BEF066|nr:aldo/keto reductase [Hamadaea sp.]NUR73469.1 aldo/keto reductase [Hamadaea sp.]NUT24248.1 aldo/keto reductase [Hamadaea sp.]
MPVRDQGGFRQSALVLGAAQLGMAYGIANTTGDLDQTAVDALLAKAAELGVTHVDTARAYGESEARIGAAPVKPKVITKVAPGETDVEASVTASLTALHEKSATFLLHRAADVPIAWDALRRVKDEGRADRIGVSVQNPAELFEVAKLPDLGYVQLPCNVVDRRWTSAGVADVLADDVVVTVRSVYLQGLLTAGSAVRWPHVPDEDRDAAVRVLDEVAAELGFPNRAGLLVAYPLGLSWVTSVVIGAETLDQLGENVRLASRTGLTAVEREMILDRLPPLPVQLVDPSTWGSAR